MVIPYGYSRDCFEQNILFDEPGDKDLLRLSVPTKNVKCLICDKMIKAGDIALVQTKQFLQSFKKVQ